MRYLILLILLTLCTPAVQASALSLEQATQAALENHQRIEQFRARVDQSTAMVGSARAAFLPSVDLDYSYTRRDQDSTLLSKEVSNATLTGSLNLFNGMADLHNYRAANHRASAAAYKLQSIRADIILATKQAFIETLRAVRSLDTAAEGVELLTRQQRDTTLYFKHGIIARNDLLRVEVELSNAEQNLLQAKGKLQISRRQLERVTGLRLTEVDKLDETGLGKLLSFSATKLEPYRQELLEKRSELNYLRELVSAAKRERSANKSGYLPSIDLSIAHEEYGDSLTPNGRSNNYDDDNKLMLNASWNLFNGFADKEAISASNAKIRAAAAELSDTNAALILQLETALQNGRIAAGRLQVAKTGVTQADENYRVSESRVKQQLDTTVDLLDAQFLLTRSRNLEVDARYDLYLNSAILERVLERAD